MSGSMATAHAGAGAQEGVGKAGKGAKGGKGWNSEGRKLGRAPDQAVLKRRGVLPPITSPSLPPMWARSCVRLCVSTCVASSLDMCMRHTKCASCQTHKSVPRVPPRDVESVWLLGASSAQLPLRTPPQAGVVTSEWAQKIFDHERFPHLRSCQ